MMPRTDLHFLNSFCLESYVNLPGLQIKKSKFLLAHSEFTVLLYFLVSTYVMIGQFSRPYFNVQPAKLKKYV